MTNQISRRHVVGAGAAFAVSSAAILPTRAASESAKTRPVVAELFTSQGCSSCPPANVVLGLLAARPGVLALSYSVTYWDYLGWSDTFADEVYTNRQRRYASRLPRRSVYTPQLVLDGRDEVVGSRRAEALALVEARNADQQIEAPTISLQRREGNISATLDGSLNKAGAADVFLVSFQAGRQDVPVGRGENGGRTVPHFNVVRRLISVGEWTGGSATWDLEADGALSHALLVQKPNLGPIIAAGVLNPT